MKRPISILIITKSKESGEEIHKRYDGETNFPRLYLLKIFLRMIFSL